MRCALAMVSVVALLGASAAGASAAAPAPKVAIRSIKQLPTPLPMPFNERQSSKDATAEVDAAFARAKARNTRVLVDFGGNWCGWCRILDAVVARPDVKPFVEQHFEVIHVYVASSRRGVDRNKDILKRFDLNDIAGFPWVVIADANGNVLHSSYEITDDHHQTPQAMVDWIAKWAL